MKTYVKLIRIDLMLALRDKSVLFFNYLFPLFFFFAFAALMDVAFVVSMVLTLGILGNGLFGAGMRLVQERDNNILRRFKVAPISPTPILVASTVTGWLLYLPAVVLVLGLSLLYGMPLPDRLWDLFLIISIGLFAFRSIGLILASVANSVQEVNILIQLFYVPMLFLSGALFPLTFLPAWLQMFAQYIPATYLTIGIQGVLLKGEGILENLVPALALGLTLLLGLFISGKLFRWEKEEKVRMASKLWVAAVLAPFLLMGTYQLYSQEQIRKAKILYRSMQRADVVLIRGARIFVGDGEVIESGSVLIREGRISRVFPDERPEAGEYQASLLEAPGKTLLPGLIDAHVHLLSPGLISGTAEAMEFEDLMRRSLASHLYCGVTGVHSFADPVATAVSLRGMIEDGEFLGAELFVSGPMFTTEGGHGAKAFDALPEALRTIALREFLRLPATPAEARQQVRSLHAQGVDSIKAVLDAGWSETLMNRMDLSILTAVSEEAASLGLPLMVHTGDARDVEDAVAANATVIEHGSSRNQIPESTFGAMRSRRVRYNPTLSVLEAVVGLGQGDDSLLRRSLALQVADRSMLEATRVGMRTELEEPVRAAIAAGDVLTQGKENLNRAFESGVRLVAGSDAGNLFVLHGPSLHRELQLWVEAGIPPREALRAATSEAAQLLGAGDRIGLIRPGYEATLLLVDGDPTTEISATERISDVFFKGERVNRSALFKQ